MKTRITNGTKDRAEYPLTAPMMKNPQIVMICVTVMNTTASKAVISLCGPSDLVNSTTHAKSLFVNA